MTQSVEWQDSEEGIRMNVEQCNLAKFQVISQHLPEEDNKIPVMTEPGIPQIQRSANHLTVTLQICMIVYTYVQTHHKVTVITIKEYKQWFLPVQ